MTPDDLKRAGVMVRKLHFSQSKVFGYMKRLRCRPHPMTTDSMVEKMARAIAGAH